MKNFIDKTVKPFLVIAGLGTCAAGFYAFMPRFSVETMSKLTFSQDYVIFVQHWGMMVMLMGICMIISAFKASWRTPILIYSVIEKAFMVGLFLFYGKNSFAAGFQGPAIMDAIIVVYLLLYFWKGSR
jgi:hypothetical protein